MLVVSDTSPLRGLSAIGRMDLVAALYVEIVVPPAVVSELQAPVAKLPTFSVSDYTFMRVHRPVDVDRVATLARRLNPGEAEAIAVALELRAGALLIDEDRGRKVATQLGIHPIGLLGVLTEAKTKGLIPAIKPLLQQLRERIAFRIDERLVERVLRAQGEP